MAAWQIQRVFPNRHGDFLHESGGGVMLDVMRVRAQERVLNALPIIQAMYCKRLTKHVLFLCTGQLAPDAFNHFDQTLSINGEMPIGQIPQISTTMECIRHLF
jgi:hypothetical protein